MRNFYSGDQERENTSEKPLNTLLIKAREPVTRERSVTRVKDQFAKSIA